MKQTKYDNETKHFFDSITKSNGIMLKDLAETLNVKYATLHHATKVNKISYRIYVMFLQKISMTPEQIDKLKELV